MAAEPEGAGDVEAGAMGSAMDAAMLAFRDRARVTNLARVEVIADALNAMRDGSLTEEERLSARAAAHSLVGSAGTFGFEGASPLGRALEALLDDGDAAEDQQLRAERGWQLVTGLREALADSAAATPASRAGDDSS